MKKEETVAALREEYLAGKSVEEREAFVNKPIEKQYSTLMTWKHRRAKSTPKAAPRKEQPKGIVEYLAAACKAVTTDADLSAETLAVIRYKVEALYDAMNSELLRRREAEIAALEQQQQAIASRLEELRGKAEEPKYEAPAPPQPSLFDLDGGF